MKIVMLIGPSSAGKSTLSEELKSSFQWQMISGDDVMDQIYLSEGASLKNELNDAGLIKALAKYMTDEEAVRLCQNGLLNISKGEHLVVNHQVPNASLPNIEEVLKDAGFVDDEVSSLAKLLRLVGKVHLSHKFPDVIDKTFDAAFSGKYGRDDFVVLDIVPVAKNSKPLFEKFQKRVDQYRKVHGNDAIESFIVLAYTTPQQLSERIHRRNIEADENNNPRNKRVGLFPFDQLAGLVAANKGASTNSTSKILGTVSNPELLKIAYHHRRNKPDDQTDKKGIALFRRAAQAALDYVRLAKNMNMPKNLEATADLSVVGSLKFDVIINTSDGNPNQLANTVVNSIQSLRTARSLQSQAQPEEKERQDESPRPRK